MTAPPARPKKRRDYREAREKVDREGCCRVCKTTEGLQAAHIISRAQVRPGAGEHPDNIVPLCGVRCHPDYDQGKLDLMPYLSAEELARSVLLHPGRMLGALQRITNTRWKEAA